MAVHIRRGDKTQSEAVGHTTSEYAVAVQEVVHRRRLGHILLSSNDDETLHATDETLHATDETLHATDETLQETARASTRRCG